MFPSNGSRQCSSSHPLYTNISPTSSTTFVPLGALGLCICLYSSMTLLAPVPSINIGQGSPPRFKVVDISQLGLSLCRHATVESLVAPRPLALLPRLVSLYCSSHVAHFESSRMPRSSCRALAEGCGHTMQMYSRGHDANEFANISNAAS